MDNDALAAAAILSQLGEDLSADGLEKLSEWQWEEMRLSSGFVKTEDGYRKKNTLTLRRTSGNDDSFKEAGTRLRYEASGSTYVFVIGKCVVSKTQDENRRSLWITDIEGDLHLVPKQ